MRHWRADADGSDRANNGLHPASAMQANTLDHQVNREHHGLHKHIYQRVHNSTVSFTFDLFPVIIPPRPQSTLSTLFPPNTPRKPGPSSGRENPRNGFAYVPQQQTAATPPALL